MSWVDALGWFGSALLVFSLLQARILRLRVLNTVACGILTVLQRDPRRVADGRDEHRARRDQPVFIVRMLRERGDEQAYAVLQVREDDRYLRHFLDLSPHATSPASSPTSHPEPAEGRSTYLVQHGDETAGVIVVRDAGDDTAQVELDYVTPRFRDFAPGEFVFRRSGLFRDRGFTPRAHRARHGRAVLRPARLRPRGRPLPLELG